MPAEDWQINTAKDVDPGKRLVGPDCLILLQSREHAIIIVHCSRRGVAVMASYQVVYCIIVPLHRFIAGRGPVYCAHTSGTLAVSVASAKRSPAHDGFGYLPFHSPASDDATACFGNHVGGKSSGKTSGAFRGNDIWYPQNIS